MAAPPSITDLFAGLALHLQSPLDQEEDKVLNISISNLNQSLNLNANPNPNSEFRVLDTALSLMCFKAPQVFERNLEYLVKAIVSVLSSSINCKVWRVQNEESLQIGGSISRRNCMELLEMCEDLYAKLEEHGVLPNVLLHTVVRLAVSTSRYQYVCPVTSIIDVKSSEESRAVSNLYCHLPRALSLENQEIPLRMLFWYLDPLTLRQAVLQILKDAINRPFLCLSEEFYQRMDWRAFIICLALSPVMFTESRALLHNWFLMTGLASILDLVVGIVSAILDVISRPTWWGLNMELGSKLPFSSAYFPYKNHLLRVLAGALSLENFLNLVHATRGQFSHGRKHAMEVARTDHKSLWALVIDFPEWFYFASFLLFAGNNLEESLMSKCTLATAEMGQMHDEESLSSAAARYIAWVLSPISKSNQNLLVECLTKISESWTLKQFGSGTDDEEAAYCKKKLKKLKIHDKREVDVPAKEYDWQKMRTWLRETQNIYVKYTDRTAYNSASCEANASHGFNLQKNVLLRKILLGILIGFPNYVTDDGWELLLHYAATDRIVQQSEITTAGMKHGRWNSERHENSSTSSPKCSKREASAGACLVFSLTDIVENISASYFEIEEGLDFVYQDLINRLARWRHQGREVLLFQNDMDDVINSLSCRSSSLSGD
ncbi:hypothetical protein SLA2020_214810 [Shorea laevis]